MSKVAIQGNASGTGTFTIAAPNSNTDRTLTLPDEAGTVLTSASSLPAANLTGSLPAGMGGKVLQVQSLIKTSAFNITSGTFAAITGYNLSITPSSSSNKILVLASFSLSAPPGMYGAFVKMYRNSTQIFTGDSNGSRQSQIEWVTYPGSGSPNHGQLFTVQVLDTPATTSAVNYNFTMRSWDNFQIAYFGIGYNDGGGSNITPATITLMEIAA